ncbi:group II intron reverse transcriptase/maturase, partial [[Clostridium] innocuum]|uniref:group II intron maturase-specific domain-containing protein n=1 Tax=Clostridium innocuum TaxID=1522 RepID=UPI002342EA02
ERAGTVAREVISSLGLEMEMNKTKIVNFEDDDFTFLGFDFRHWRTSKKGNRYYYIEPAEKSLKEFKKKIKDKTQRKLTLSKEEWIKQVNTVIVGKVNYYLNVYKAIEVLKRHDIE